MFVVPAMAFAVPAHVEEVHFPAYNHTFSDCTIFSGENSHMPENAVLHANVTGELTIKPIENPDFKVQRYSPRGFKPSASIPLIEARTYQGLWLPEDISGKVLIRPNGSYSYQHSHYREKNEGTVEEPTVVQGSPSGGQFTWSRREVMWYGTYSLFYHPVWYTWETTNVKWTDSTHCVLTCKMRTRRYNGYVSGIDANPKWTSDSTTTKTYEGRIVRTHGDPPDPSAIHARILTWSSQLNARTMALDATEACMKAVETVTTLNSNNIENLSQASDVAGFFPPIREAFDFAMRKDIQSAAAFAASAYLWYTYAVKPTVADLEDLVKHQQEVTREALTSIQTGTHRAARKGQDGSMQWSVHAKVVLEPRARTILSDTLNVLDNLGLKLSLQRAWDLVPYSFVVDWFSNAAELLGAWEVNSGVFNTYDIRHVVVGRKAVDELDITDMSTEGWEVESTIKAKCYYRWVGYTIPARLSLKPRGLTETGHILAGTALLVANAG